MDILTTIRQSWKLQIEVLWAALCVCAQGLEKAFHVGLFWVVYDIPDGLVVWYGKAWYGNVAWFYPWMDGCVSV
jgi:hypothetical protein